MAIRTMNKPARRSTPKAALMAAASLAVASLAGGAMATSAYAAPTIEEVVIAPERAAAPLLDEAPEASPHGRFLALSAAAAATLALIVRLIGWPTIRRAVADAAPHVARAAKTAAETAVKAPLAAARFVGERVSSPLRALLVFLSLGLTAFVGVGVYDLEWLGGLLVGAVIATMSLGGVARARGVLARAGSALSSRQDG